MDSTHKPNNPQLRYTQDGRGGAIHYVNQETRFDMWYELAMPPAIIIIGIPEPQHWEAQTKTPLSQRETILTFIGEQVIQGKLRTEAYVRIEQDNIMTIFTGRDPEYV